MTPAETVSAFIAAIEARQIERAAALVSEQVSYENMPIAPIVGRQAMVDTLEGFLAPAAEVDWQILGQWEQGSTVLNERLDRFRIGDGWLELAVFGRFEVGEDGLINLWRDYFDMQTYVRRLTELTTG